MADVVLEGGEAGVPYTPSQLLVNGLLAGSFFLVGFYRAQDHILARFPWLGSGTKRGPGGR